jgi:hypothetical protein
MLLIFQATIQGMIGNNSCYEAGRWYRPKLGGMNFISDALAPPGLKSGFNFACGK